MSQNPYQSEPGLDDGAFTAEFEHPPRTSILAIFSALLAIPCCIPGAGLLAAVLGGVSLGIIRNARGRLSGRVAAIIGIFLGLFVTVLQVAIGIGAMQAYTYYNKQMAPVAETFFLSASQGDYTQARSVLTQDASDDVTDERIASFIQAIEVNEGTIQGVTTSFGQIIESFANVYSGSRSRTTVSASGQGPDIAPIPFRIDTASGSIVGVLVFDSNTLGGGGALMLVDVFALLPGGHAVTLREDGPAARHAAAQFGAIVIEHEEAAQLDTVQVDENDPADSEQDESAGDESPE